jgi:hypothetical protein
MTRFRYAPVVWLRDKDGTGRLHPCDRDDPGALAYIPAERAEDVAGLEVWPTRQTNAPRVGP